MKFFISLFQLGCLLLIQACVSTPSQPIETDKKQSNTPITVQGHAQIKNGATLLARKQAFSNAIRNASIQLGTNVSSNSVIGSTKVVDEWITDDIYHLQVLSVLSKDSVCHSPYRKKIVATAFPIVSSGQISGNETQDLYSGIPREIMNSLMESGHFIGRNDTHTVLYSRPDMAPELSTATDYQTPATIQVAQGHGDQFVLSGVIRDLEVEATEYIRGAGIFAQIKSMTRDFSARRGIAIDIYVHDGFNGALLFQHRYTDTVIGDVWIPAGYSVGSERFKSTPAGHKISKIIQLASQDINNLFSCYPFAAKIVKIKDDKIYISAGAQNKLKQGDRLAVYTANSNAALQENKLIGTVNISTIQANFSIGKTDIISDVRQIKVGDYVKSY